MGRHKKHGNWKGKKQNPKENKCSGSYDTSKFTTENKAFEVYYKLQLQQEFSNESEFSDFKKILREKLPVVFRINNTVPNYQNFLNKLKNPEYMRNLLSNENKNDENIQNQEEQKIDQNEVNNLEKINCKNISWYPEELVWQINTFRHELKKNKAYQNLHKFIHKATEAGLISRQELVSMLPPLLLNVQNSDFIFDMCAAPGSKTAQLLELLYKDESLGKGLTRGGIIANDIDYSRAAMLIHQIQRISTAGIMVVNHSGQHYPTMKQHSQSNDSKEKKQLYFDKILADVPCSGDGAIRKLPEKWSKWSVKDGMGLHSLQLQIAMRAIHLVKVGGLVLYSTCSINPIEDEAVVVELLRRCKNDALELVDIREKVPGLIARPGLLNWYVCEDKVKETNHNQEINFENLSSGNQELVENFSNIYQSFEQLPEGYKGPIRSSMFPDTAEKMREIYKIQNTVRILPHDQNTSGFYLALIRKKDHAIFETEDNLANKCKDQIIQSETKINPGVSLENKEAETLEENKKKFSQKQETKNFNNQTSDIIENSQPEKIIESSKLEEETKMDNKVKKTQNEPEENQPTPLNNKRKVKKEQELPKKLTFDDLDPLEWNWIREYYGIEVDTIKDLLIQQTQGDRKVSLISPSIKKVLDLEKNKSVLNKLNMGVKAFHRNREVFLNNECRYRLCQDAISALFPYITKRKIKCSASDLIYMIKKQNVKSIDLPSDELKKKIEQLGKGSFLLYSENDAPIQAMECLTCLCHGPSVSVMASAELIESLKLRYIDI